MGTSPEFTGGLNEAAGTYVKGCTTTCLVENGFYCGQPSGNSQPSVCAAVCGDKILAGTEQCDDGNTQSGDGCSSTCTFEAGWSCSSTKGLDSQCFPICDPTGTTIADSLGNKGYWFSGPYECNAGPVTGT